MFYSLLAWYLIFWIKAQCSSCEIFSAKFYFLKSDWFPNFRNLLDFRTYKLPTKMTMQTFGENVDWLVFDSIFVLWEISNEYVDNVQIAKVGFLETIFSSFWYLFGLPFSNHFRETLQIKWIKITRYEKFQLLSICSAASISDGIYLLKVNNGNIKTMWEICSKLTRKIPGWRQCNHSYVLNFKHISHIILNIVHTLPTLNK